jgi:hypothetical protein
MAMAKSELQFTQHFYQDHSQDKPTSEDDYEIMNCYSHSGPYNDESRPSCVTRRAKKSSRKLNFLLKLHHILENSGRDESHEMAISWKIHGRAFSVNNSKEFFEAIIPLYFHQTKLRSFFRQLNLYGFRRITKGRDKGAYYHELFLRGKPFLTWQISRKKVKGVGFRGTSIPETEPDFYSMPYVMGIYSLPTLPRSSTPTIVPKDSKELLCALKQMADMQDDVFHGHQLQGKNFFYEEGDLDPYFFGKLRDKSLSDFSFLDGEDFCALSPERNKFQETTNNEGYVAVKNRLAVDETSDLFQKVGDVQHLSSQECTFLGILLQKVSEDLDSML